VPTNPFTDPDWATRTVDFIDRNTARVRRYTTQPVVTTARGIVFGTIAAFGIVGMVVLLSVGITRGLQAALDAAFARDTAVWMSYLILSALCTGVGTILMRKRFNKGEE
jgi:hypothetical protein